jgi:hypothetical protein
MGSQTQARAATNTGVSVVRRIDEMQALLAKWEQRLEREGLRAIRDGEGVPLPQLGRHDIPASDRGYARVDSTKPGGGREGRRRNGSWHPSDAPLPVYERVQQSVWDLTAATDKLLAAYWRFKFASRKDRRICQLLGKGLTWRVVAARVRCSKRRVGRVYRQVMAWTDPA